MGFCSGIYEVVNRENGERYIGSAVNMPNRWKAHRWALRGQKHHSPHLQAAWNKYGEGAFEFNPVMLCEKDVLREWEQQYMDGFAPEYNIATSATNPMLGRKHSDATRARMSEKLIGNTRSLGRQFSDEHKRKIGDRTRGRKFPPEFGARVSAAKKGRPVAKRGPMPMSQRLAIAEARRGWKMPEAQRLALAESMRGNTFAHVAAVARKGA